MNKVKTFSVSGNIVDVVNKEIFYGTINIENGKIVKIVHCPQSTVDSPLFIDNVKFKD